MQSRRKHDSRDRQQMAKIKNRTARLFPKDDQLQHNSFGYLNYRGTRINSLLFGAFYFLAPSPSPYDNPSPTQNMYSIKAIQSLSSSSPTSTVAGTICINGLNVRWLPPPPMTILLAPPLAKSVPPPPGEAELRVPRPVDIGTGRVLLLALVVLLLLAFLCSWLFVRL